MSFSTQLICVYSTPKVTRNTISLYESLLFLLTVTAMMSPESAALSLSMKSDMFSIVLASILVIMSPVCMPALYAGE